MSAVKWTPEFDDKLKAMWADRYTATEISSRMWSDLRVEFSRNAVCGRLHRLGLMKHRAARSNLPKPIKAADPKPKPIDPDMVNLRCQEIVPRHLSLIDLEPGDCRYPYGDSNFTFCGHPQVDGAPYCLDHLALCIGRGTHGERRTNIYDVQRHIA